MDAKHIVTLIEAAFSDVDWVETSLRQFKIMDESGMSGDTSGPEWETARNEWHAGKKRKRALRWREIADAEIEECGCLLAHMQAREFRYYLPAYMIYALLHYDPRAGASGNEILQLVVSRLSPNIEDGKFDAYTIEQYKLLNALQAKTIVTFLQFFVELEEDEFNYELRRDARCALEGYWTQRVGTN